MKEKNDQQGDGCVDDDGIEVINVKAGPPAAVDAPPEGDVLSEEDYTALKSAPLTQEGGDTTMKTKKTKADKSAAKAKKVRPARSAAIKSAKPKTTRSRRSAPASGSITGVSVHGATYLELAFTEGSIRLTPTSNREHNRDLAVKAIKALLK